jgi:hypothetical protein
MTREEAGMRIVEAAIVDVGAVAERLERLTKSGMVGAAQMHLNGALRALRALRDGTLEETLPGPPPL